MLSSSVLALLSPRVAACSQSSGFVSQRPCSTSRLPRAKNFLENLTGLLEASVGRRASSDIQHNATVLAQRALKKRHLSHRLMKIPKGRRKATGGPIGRPPKEKKRAKAAAARDAAVGRFGA